LLEGKDSFIFRGIPGKLVAKKIGFGVCEVYKYFRNPDERKRLEGAGLDK
jgi:hypothetical protein